MSLPLVVDLPAQIFAGEPLEVELVLSSGRRRRGGLSVTFLSVARLELDEAPAVEEILHRARIEWPTQTFAMGQTRLRARFDIPAELPPSFEGHSLAVRHNLVATLEHDTGSVRVPVRVHLLGAAPVTAPPRPILVTTEGAGRGPRAELALASDVLHAGRVLDGALAIDDSDRGAGRVVASLVCVEATPGGENEIGRWTTTVHDGAFVAGAPLPFHLRAPEDGPPSFAVAGAQVSWHVDVAVERLWRSEALLRAPLTILAPPRAGTPRPPPAPPLLVGRERRAGVWAVVAAETGLALLAGGAIGGRLGEVDVVIDLEQRAAELWTVGRLRWPALGLDLEVGTAGWNDVISRAEIEVGEPGFDRRFRVRGREPAQVRAFLDAEVRAALSAVPSLVADDDGAVLARPGSISDPKKLRAFVDEVRAAARACAAAAAALPPPAALATPLEEWRALAHRLSARFEVGRVRLHGGRRGDVRVEAGLEWSVGGACAGVVLRCHPARPLAERAAETAEADALHAVGTLRLNAEEITLTLPGQASPAEVERLLEQIVALATLGGEVYR